MGIYGDISVAIATILSVIIAGIITARTTMRQVKKENKNTLAQLKRQHQDAIRQMEAETQILKKRKYNEQTLKALQGCWGLLIYTTDNENPKAIITYTVEKEENNKKYTYYFHKSNIDSFIDSLRNYFYVNGWGLYLSKELKEQLFGYERIVWGLKLRGEEFPDDKQQIEKSKVAESLFEIHRKLIEILHQDVNNVYN